LNLNKSMSSTAQTHLGGVNATVSKANDMIRWPLAYSLQLPKQQQGQQSLQSLGFDSSRPEKKSWWSHRMYKGPNGKPVQILYSKTIENSETLARQFLHEDVIGFDMEWPWNDWKRADLQNKVGLIQVASEDKIALFHIGLHTGKTTNDIIAPSLRKLIESPRIGKLGVGVLSADFARLRRFFRLDPKGAVELSHLYRLTKFGERKPELVSTKLVSLARLVEDQLGHPLYKGDVRTSNWSKPLSKDQINYAAGDAYAGLMLYHCMNFKRVRMTPIPPLPVHAENYLAAKLSGVIPLRLQQQVDDGSMLTSEAFFGVAMADSAPLTKSKTKDKKGSTTSKPNPPEVKLPKELIDAVSQALFNELLARRAILAEQAKIPVYRVAPTTVLVALALERPSNTDQLLTIKGVGTKQQEKYGDIWLQTIAHFLDPNAAAASSTLATSTRSLEHTGVPIPTTPTRRFKRRSLERKESSDSSPAFETPPSRTPNLHTGLSFTMAKAKLDDEANAAEADESLSDSDESLQSLDFGTPPPGTDSQLKRKRTTSPIREGAHTASHLLQQMTQTRDSDSPPRGPSHSATLKKQTAPARPPDAPLSPRSKIARNKLTAFSKLVTGKMGARPPDAPPIVTERTLDLIIIKAPRTLGELEEIPGIDSFLLACRQTDTDMLKNIVKFAPVRS
jgi:ribonuclease D